MARLQWLVLAALAASAHTTAVDYAGAGWSRVEQQVHGSTPVSFTVVLKEQGRCPPWAWRCQFSDTPSMQLNVENRSKVEGMCVVPRHRVKRDLPR